MHLMWLLGVLLLHVDLASPDAGTCQVFENAYPVVKCGPPGVNGQPGINGVNGQKGAKGEPGLRGVNGSPGPRGAQGAPGPQGDKGDTGPMGPPGLNGQKGDQGTSGVNGQKGDSGVTDLDLIQAQITGLAGQVQDLLSHLEQQRKVLGFFKKTVRVGGKIYATTGGQANYTEALAICANVGGSLAAPHDATENDAILSIVLNYGTNAYLGINSLLTTGIFRYLTGVGITYTNWSQSEPNNLATEFCVEMYNTGKWNNRPCEKIDLVICEF